jgi:tetratricopeptide (TPR) repeat protein
MNPEDATLALQTSQQLIATKRYAEVAALLEKPIIANAQRYDLQVERAIGLLRSGNKDEGRAEAQKIAKGTADSDLLNNLAYEMAETGISVQMAREMAQKAVDQLEHDCAQVTLGSLEAKDLKDVNSLASAWDTLGWIYFKRNDLTTAEKYIVASWRLSQRAEVADHLRHIYDKMARHAEPYGCGSSPWLPTTRTRMPASSSGKWACPTPALSRSTRRDRNWPSSRLRNSES